jgi:hypothetical protein
MQKQKPNKSFSQYLSLATQMFIMLGVGTYAGIKFDHWVRIPIPLAAWLLPLLILVWYLYQIIRDTGTGK